MQQLNSCETLQLSTHPPPRKPRGDNRRGDVQPKFFLFFRLVYYKLGSYNNNAFDNSNALGIVAKGGKSVVVQSWPENIVLQRGGAKWC